MVAHAEHAAFGFGYGMEVSMGAELRNISQRPRIGTPNETIARRKENRRLAAIHRAARTAGETAIGEYYFPEFYAAQRRRRAQAYLRQFTESRGQNNVPRAFLGDAEYARCASFGSKSGWGPLTPVGRLEAPFGEIDAVALDWWRLSLHPNQRRMLSRLVK